MANVYKPQQPLNKNGSYLFPRTTVDQVYYDAPADKMLDAKLNEMDNVTKAADSKAVAAQNAAAAADSKAVAAQNAAAAADSKAVVAQNGATTALAAATKASQYKSGTAARDTSNTTGGTVTWHKCGRLVMVYVDALGLKVSAINASTWKAYTVATGLPAPMAGTPYELLAIEASQSDTGRFRVTASGELQHYHHDTALVRGAQADTAAASGVITYIAVE